MPYRKKGYKKAYKGKRKESDGAKALRMVKTLKSKVKPELKFYDESNGISPDSSAATTTNVKSVLRGITEGGGAIDVIGQKINIRSITWQLTGIINTSATSTRTRYCLVWDNKPESAVPLWSEIFTTTGVTSGLNSLLNIYDNPGRFRVLMDNTYVYNITDKQEYNTKLKYIKLNKTIRFNGSLVPERGDILFCALSDEATNVPALSMQTRLRYYDM